MRKLIMFVLIMLFVLLPVAVYASDAEKAVPVELSVIPDEISLGESITVKATVEKHGSSFRVNWINAQEVSTEYDEITGQYLSTAEFTPNEAGTFEIIYKMDMEAGNSGVLFSGMARKTVIVTDTKTVIGAEIKNITQSPVMNGEIITSYRVTGQAYAIWSDGTETDLNQAVFLFFKPDELQKEVLISFSLEGKAHQFKASVVRTVPDSLQ